MGFRELTGVSVTPRGDRVQIMGDISGDESGYVNFDEGCAVETTPGLSDTLSRLDCQTPFLYGLSDTNGTRLAVTAIDKLG
jgi:hypothetical protein